MSRSQTAALLVGLLALLLGLAGCNSAASTASSESTASAAADDTAATPPPFDLAAGFSAAPLPYEFSGPTQFFVDDGDLWLAELNGEENAGQGRVWRIDLDSGAQTLLVTDLDKPTGIALLDGQLYVAARNTLLRFDAAAPGGEPEVLLADTTFNGRSNGTLTVTPDNLLLYETSATRRDPQSGRLWTYDPAADRHETLATGLKNGYAHFFDSAGRLWITEIADGEIDGVTPTDEINLVVPGADFGWPTCYGRELTGPDCDGARPAVAVFPAHATPTSIVVSPFAPDTLLVTLWVTGEVVAVPYELVGDNAVGDAAAFISGMSGPQTIITRPDGAVWIGEFGSGLIWEIRPAGA